MALATHSNIIQNQVREVGFIHKVKVDGVWFNSAYAFRQGIKEIARHENGIRIFWNFGVVFVPYANVAYVDERESKP